MIALTFNRSTKLSHIVPNGQVQVQEFYGFKTLKNNDMNTELKYQKETGLPSRKRNTGNPHSYTNEYIKWHERQVKLLDLQCCVFRCACGNTSFKHKF